MEKISKYLEDKRFIAWVFNPDKELEKWWVTFETGYPHEKQNIQLARKVLLKLKTADKKLSEEEKIMLFSKILKQVEEKQHSGKTARIISGFLKYAAVAILFFSIGALLFYRKDNFNRQFYSQNLSEPIPDNEAKLIRPDGENIILKEKNSVIEYSNNGQVKVNQNVLNPISQVEKGTPVLNQLVIPYGKTSELILSDGTKVYLNAGSRLVYPEYFSESNREVFLVGEAFFEVKHDKNHPFIVQTTDLKVRVLGTKFNVSAYPSDDNIQAVLTEGKICLVQNNSGIFTIDSEMEPGQLASFDKTTREIRLSMVDTENYTLWKDGMFKFESTDLNRVAKKLERFYNIRFQYSNSMLGAIKISGKLKLDENREEIIKRIAVAASLKIIKTGENNYEIKN